MRRALAVCSGSIPSREDLIKHILPGTTLIATDGAANRLVEDGLWPNVVIGDFDSISSHTLEKLHQKNIETLCLVSQYKCDLEKALDLCVERQFLEVSLIGMLGGRADYTLANAVVLFQYLSKLQLTVIEPHFNLYPMTGTRRFSSQPKQLMSLVPWGLCKGVTLEGVQYRLDRHDFKVGEMGVSNVALSESFEVTIEEGYAWVFVGDPEHAFAPR